MNRPKMEPTRGSAAHRPGDVVHSVQLPSSTRPQETAPLVSSAHTMSLLTPTESRAFQSFLDTAAFPVDWSMQFDISHEHMPPASGTEALTKATKDLMSLDRDNWRCSLGPYSSRESPSTSLYGQQQTQTHPLALSHPTRQHRSLHSHPDDAELAIPLSTHPGPSNPHGQLSQLPFYHVATDLARIRADPNSYDHSSSSSSSRQSPADLLPSSSSPAGLLSSSAKRSPPPDAKSSNKRRRPSALQNPDEPQLPPQSRAALLSPSQKKANHIQSEQKRRANIRRGYDALCDIVPALREACQAEDEQQLVDGKPRNRRRGKAKALGDESERIDGRAGPRSENVVLSKTIDYLHVLLSERESLMQRLHVARSSLPPDHPLLHPRPDTPLPLWERKWTGGEKGNEDEDEDEDD